MASPCQTIAPFRGDDVSTADGTGVVAQDRSIGGFLYMGYPNGTCGELRDEQRGEG